MQTDLNYFLRRRLETAKTNTRKRGLPLTVDLTFLHDLLKKQAGKCYYSNITMTLESGDNMISIDRKDCTKGYTPDNIVLCCWRINNMKRDMDAESFLELCKTIATYQIDQDTKTRTT